MKTGFTKLTELITLYDYYKPLLTDKQRKYFELYFFDDYSLAEIAHEYNISRIAVHDALTTIKATLQNFEAKLKLSHKDQLREQVYKNITDPLLLKKLRVIDNL